MKRCSRSRFIRDMQIRTTARDHPHTCQDGCRPSINKQQVLAGVWGNIKNMFRLLILSMVSYTENESTILIWSNACMFYLAIYLLSHSLGCHCFLLKATSPFGVWDRTSLGSCSTRRAPPQTPPPSPPLQVPLRCTQAPSTVSLFFSFLFKLRSLHR